MQKKHKSLNYAKWGYIFIIPFFIVFILFTLVPLVMTIVSSFIGYESDSGTPKMTGAVGFGNYKALFEQVSYSSNGGPAFFVYARNTLIMWVMGFLPQLILAFLTAVIFASAGLRIKGRSFFRWAVFLPSLIMPVALGALFFAVFEGGGSGVLEQTWSARAIVALVSCLMSFGSTAVLLAASMSAIDRTLFEAAAIEGEGAWGMFCKITLPHILPVIIYSALISLIGGLQMFDVPRLLTNGAPEGSTMTLAMWIAELISAGDYGRAGAVSVLVLAVTVILSVIAYKIIGVNRKRRA